ncbi:hypothetical protein ACO0QE_000292 [Hanseniaspora vineae]
MSSTTVNYPTEFKGFAVAEPEKWDKPELISFEPKKFTDEDVDIEIECNGICGSDLHTLKNEWSPDRKTMVCHASKYGPKAQVVGHEIVGKVVKKGANVTGLELGQRVGVGASCYSCGKCRNCKKGFENHCINAVHTYNFMYPDGYVSQGGYASHIRCSSSMVFPIPEGVKSEYVAPLLCGGLTVFSPIRRHITPVLEKGLVPEVGVVGIGGLGHMAVIIAKALGANVTAISRSYAKKEDAFKMGATDFIATGDEKTEWAKYAQKFDLIINCATTNANTDVNRLASMLSVGSSIVSVGVGELSETFTIAPFAFVMGGCGFFGSAIGSNQDAMDLLKLAAEKDINPWVETIPISEENIHTALTRMDKGDCKYRFTLNKYDEFFKIKK